MMDNDDDGKDAHYAPSRNRHAMRTVLCEADARRRSGYIPRCALQHPLVSAFSTLYRSGDDSALITVTGFNHAGFQYLLSKFALLYDKYTPYSDTGEIRPLLNCSGRPRTLDHTLGLAVVLLWTRSRGNQFLLGMIFGVLPSRQCHCGFGLEEEFCSRCSYTMILQRSRCQQIMF